MLHKSKYSENIYSCYIVDKIENLYFPCETKKPEMVNAPDGLSKVILRKIKRFDCNTNQVSSKQLASL